MTRTTTPVSPKPAKLGGVLGDLYRRSRETHRAAARLFDCVALSMPCRASDLEAAGLRDVLRDLRANVSTVERVLAAVDPDTARSRATTDTHAEVRP